MPPDDLLAREAPPEAEVHMPTAEEQLEELRAANRMHENLLALQLKLMHTDQVKQNHAHNKAMGEHLEATRELVKVVGDLRDEVKAIRLLATHATTNGAAKDAALEPITEGEQP